MSNDRAENAVNRGAFCPACERFIGAADVCPYCDADSARPPFLRVLRWASLALAVGGLAFLYLMSVGKEIPVVKIADITPLMNFAQVQITGTVQKKPFIGKETGTVDYLSFYVDDGSGQLRVVARGDVARQIEASGAVPKKDDAIEATGVIEARTDAMVTLRLRATKDLRKIRVGEAQGTASGLNSPTIPRTQAKSPAAPDERRE